MKFSPRGKGLCFVCGKSTSLNIHQNCGKSKERVKKLRPITDRTITFIVRGVEMRANG